MTLRRGISLVEVTISMVIVSIAISSSNDSLYIVKLLLQSLLWSNLFKFFFLRKFYSEPILTNYWSNILITLKHRI